MKNNLSGLLGGAGLAVLAAAPPALGQDIVRGRDLYETHCGLCHYERVHQRLRSTVKDLDDLRDTVARWAPQTRRSYGADELEDIVQYLNASHYRFGMAARRHACGGVGADGRAEMKKREARANAALLFVTAKRGGYLADIPFRVLDRAGKAVVEDVAEGPLCLLDLPPGPYRVEATYGGAKRGARFNAAEARGRPPRTVIAFPRE